jgi:hypothetical protein
MPLKENAEKRSYIKPCRKNASEEKPDDMTEKAWERHCIQRRYEIESCKGRQEVAVVKK